MHKLAPCIPTGAFSFLAREAAEEIELRGWLRTSSRSISLNENELGGEACVGGLWLRILGPGALEAWSMWMAESGPRQQGIQLVAGKIDRPAVSFDAVLRELGLAWAPAGRLWLRIAPLVQALGHGGAFVIPTADADPYQGIGPCRKVAGPSLAELMPPPYDSAVDPPTASALQPLLDATTCIVHMSATDGCVIVDRKMRVWAFAAEIAVTDDPGDRVESRGPGERGTLDVKHLGTRHRSAIRYCGAHPGAIAIVVSQDGGMSVFHKAAAEPVARYGPFQRVVPSQVDGATE